MSKRDHTVSSATRTFNPELILLCEHRVNTLCSIHFPSFRGYGVELASVAMKGQPYEYCRSDYVDVTMWLSPGQTATSEFKVGILL